MTHVLHLDTDTMAPLLRSPWQATRTRWLSEHTLDWRITDGYHVPRGGRPRDNAQGSAGCILPRIN